MTNATMRHVKTGRINLGSLKAACRKLWKAMDLDGLEALKNEIDISDLYHRDFVEGYLEMVRQGRSYVTRDHKPEMNATCQICNIPINSTFARYCGKCEIENTQTPEFKVNATMRAEIDSLVMEHDVEALGALLCRYELDEDLRGLLYAAIDVASNMPLLNIDQIHILN